MKTKRKRGLNKRTRALLSWWPNKGNTILLVIVFTTIFLIIAGGLMSLTLQERKLNLAQAGDAQALQIAETGLNYYRWHLAHEPDEYVADTGEHDYINYSGEVIGAYDIEVTPPEVGSTAVTIRSTGWLDDFPQRTRVVEAKYGISSLAHYAFLTNSNIWLGDTESISGEMHSNGGVRMDGTTNARMTSAKETYTCTSEHGCSGQTKPGIWGTGTPTDFWDFPVPAIDFDIITVDLSGIKADAKSNGYYIKKSNKQGYQVIFNANGTFDIYKVTAVKDNQRQYDAESSFYQKQKIKTKTYVGNYAIPTNGLMFIEDNVWVEGTVNGKVTLASARFPDQTSTNTTIYINDNIHYLARDGNHQLGLIAQKHVLVPRHAPSDLTIDAIMLAQKGHVMRHYYYNSVVKNSIEVYGGIITNKVWTWSWVYCDTCPVIDGYNETLAIYDSSLTYTPPPSFPTTGEYTFISWEEIQ